MSLTLLRRGQFLGGEVDRIETPSGVFVESTYPEGVRLPEHAHERSHFCLVLEGYHQERCGSSWQEREPGALTFLPAHVPHAERHHTAGRHVMVELTPQGTWSAAELLPPDPTTFSRRMAMTMVQRINRERRWRDRSTPLALESLLLELVATLSRTTGGRETRGTVPGWATDLAERLTRSAPSRPGSLAALAAGYGIDVPRLATGFRRATGLTIGEFSRKARLEWAARALTEGHTLSDVAVAAGFADQSHFTRWFRRHFGVTPGLWKQGRSKRAAF